MTVKAEDRPSGSAGASASVITPLFRISVKFREVACACRGGASAPSLSYQDGHIFLWTVLIYMTLSVKGKTFDALFEKAYVLLYT